MVGRGEPCGFTKTETKEISLTSAIHSEYSLSGEINQNQMPPMRRKRRSGTRPNSRGNITHSQGIQIRHGAGFFRQPHGSKYHCRSLQQKTGAVAGCGNGEAQEASSWVAVFPCMSIHISKNRIRATGGDANGFLIAMSLDKTLLDWEKSKTGSEQFQKMVKEAIAARGLNVKSTDVL